MKQPYAEKNILDDAHVSTFHIHIVFIAEKRLGNKWPQREIPIYDSSDKTAEKKSIEMPSNGLKHA